MTSVLKYGCYMLIGKDQLVCAWQQSGAPEVKMTVVHIGFVKL